MQSVQSPAPAVFRLPRKPRAVVFDLDGTLIDSEALVREGYFGAARKFRIDFTDEHFRSLIGLHRGANDARMFELFGADFPLPAFYAAVTADIGDAVAPLKPGARELMVCPDDARLPFALATSSGPDWVDRHFSEHRLHGRFRAIITRDDVQNRKPHPEPYLKASTLLGHRPAEILAIEDSPTGVASAHAAGLMTLMIPDLIQPDEETRAQTLYVGGSLNDVLGLLGA